MSLPVVGVAAGELDIPLEPVVADQVVEGSPQTGVADIGSTNDYRYGVWEMTPGAMWDVEVDETFVVLSGDADIIRVVDGVEHTFHLLPGVVMTLRDGERTTWIVRETVRKVWFCPPGS